MEIAHETLVALSKSWGLFYLVCFLLCVIVYACWPGNRQAFQRAKTSILDEDDTPRGPQA